VRLACALPEQRLELAGADLQHDGDSDVRRRRIVRGRRGVIHVFD
jgi:hypothetical protein